jgi:signal transduction histidine kinase/DNA-binding response OmpR family regulator
MKPLILFLVSIPFWMQDKPQVYADRAVAAAREQPDSVDSYVARAVAQYDAVNNDTAGFQLYLKLSTAFQAAGNTAAAFENTRKAWALASSKKLGDKYLWALYDHMGIYYGNIGNYDSSLWYHEKSISVAIDTISVVNSLRKIGLEYNSLGRPVQALEAYQKALHLLENKPASHMKGSVYNNLGILYEDDGNLEKAEEYYLQAARIFKESKIARSNYNVLNNLGILYSMQDRHDESLKALAEAESIVPQLKGELEVAIVNLNIGNTLAHMDRAAEAIPRFEKSMAIFKKIGDNYGIALCHRQLGEALHYVGRNAEAEKHEFESLAVSKVQGYSALIEDSYWDLSRIYEARRDFEKAYRYHKLTSQLKDSLNDKEKKSKLGLLEKEFEISQKEKEKQRLEQENVVQQARVEADRSAKVALAAGLGLFVLAAGVAGVAWLRTRKQNAILEEQKAKIEEQTEQLREAARNKARFFANVSHELRTPVTLLNGMLELMKENGPKNDEKLRLAVANSRRLQNLVDEVLDLSRLEVGKAQLHTRRVHVLPLLNRIVLAFESFLERKDIKLEYDAAALEGVMVEVDEDKFEKVLNNLLYNAIKFNKAEGWIRVTGKVAGNAHVEVDVADSGIGIPAADLPRIFERFYQSESGDRKNAQGIGIGLSLVKEFTELHGGTVSVSSAVNEGTTFRLTFPVSIDIVTDTETDTEENGLPLTVSFADFKTRPSILIVEDNEEMRYYVREILGEDVLLTDASNGREALDRLASDKPDLIISDVMMPEMNGYELLSILKGDDNMKGIPVIMLTARASEEDRLSGLSLGVDDYIIKPFNSQELKSRIHNLLMNQLIRNQWKSKPVEKDEELVVHKEDKAFTDAVESFVVTRLSDSALSMADIADHLAMSERQLYRKCGAVTGMSPAQLVKEIRLRTAYRMLLQKEVSKIGALATSVGFENSAYFSRQFLERYGKRPVELL